MLASAVDWLEGQSYQSMGISRAVHGSISVGLMELCYVTGSGVYRVLCNWRPALLMITVLR